MMDDQEIINIVAAHQEGRKIEYCIPKTPEQIQSLGPQIWSERKFQTWNFDDYIYRIAPESPTEELCPCCGNPRKCESRDVMEWWAELPLDGGVGQIFTDSRQLTKGGKLVLVREVIE